jgi:Transcriptional regulator PadR-like family
MDSICAGQGAMWCMEPGEARSALSQLRRGTVEYCMLALLRDGERSGFDLVRELSDSAGLVTSEGMIYPLLTRLRKSNWSPRRGKSPNPSRRGATTGSRIWNVAARVDRVGQKHRML